MTATVGILISELAKERESLVVRINYIDAILGSGPDEAPAKKCPANVRHATYPSVTISSAPDTLCYC